MGYQTKTMYVDYSSCEKFKRELHGLKSTLMRRLLTIRLPLPNVLDLDLIKTNGGELTLAGERAQTAKIRVLQQLLHDDNRGDVEGDKAVPDERWVYANPPLQRV